MIVTIDGPAGAGKSTVSRILARRLGLAYLNSGYIYRAVTLRVLDEGGSFDDRALVRRLVDTLDLRFVDDAPDDGTPVGDRGPEGRQRVFLGEREVTDRLKAADVTAQIFRVANNAEYRRWLIEYQRGFARGRGVVAEGRDMGTVIFPEADFKFFLDATVEERARRQYAEQKAQGGEATFDEILQGVRVRDGHDTEREHAPLRVADGGCVIMTDGHTVDDVVSELLTRIRCSCSSRRATIDSRTDKQKAQ